MSKRGDDSAGFGALLIPIDLTPASDRVLGRVALLPLAGKARLTLLHVVPGSLPPRARRRAARDAKTVLAEESNNLARSLGREITIVPIVAVGGAASEIAARSADTEAEMIVMGRGGGRVLRDVFLGSTAERVLRRAQLPVLVVRRAPRARYRRPAIALDIDDAARAALAQLLEVIPAPRPRVTVIHAHDSGYRGLIYPSLCEEDAEEYHDGYRRTAALEIAELLATALAEMNVSPSDAPTWTTHVRVGSPREVITKIVEKADTDLLALGTRGRSGLPYLFLGTVAGDVLRDVACDVLVAPPSSRRSRG